MRSEGRNSVTGFLLLAIILLFCPQVHAQLALPLLPHIDRNGENPITFMRTHYILIQAPGMNDTTLASPPISAFTPARLRHAYGFDAITNEGLGQIIGIVDAYDDANIASDLDCFQFEVQFACVHQQQRLLPQSLFKWPPAGRELELGD